MAARVSVHSALLRIILPVWLAVVALAPLAADDDSDATATRSILAPSAQSEDSTFIDEQLDQQSERTFRHAHRPAKKRPALPAALHPKLQEPIWDFPMIFEHWHKFREEQKKLPQHFRHSSLHGRHLGFGQPLEGTSWLNRPWHFSWFFGGLFGDDLTAHIEQEGDIFGGYRLGYDFDHYWGYEGRFGFANLEITDNQIPPVPRTARNWFIDGHIVYYPWGDAQWRPYATIGLGLAHFQFVDELGQPVNTLSVDFPIGVGVKYQWKKWLAVRLDLMDNIVFGGGGVNTMGSVSLSAGLEWRFGGRRPSYWPYNPSIHL